MSQVTGDVWKLLKLSNTTTADNYPESLGVFLILNAPWYFVTVWRIIKTFVDPRTIKKFKILGPNFQPVLHEYVDADNLPVEYGGNGKYGFKNLAELRTDAGYSLSKSLRLLLPRVRRKQSDAISGCCLKLQDAACLYGAPRGMQIKYVFFGVYKCMFL